MTVMTRQVAQSPMVAIDDLVDGVARIAERTPRRIAFQVRDQRTTYGQLRAAIDGMRLVTRGQGMSNSAAVVAAVMHCAPSLAVSGDPRKQAEQVDAVMLHVLRDPAVQDGVRRRTVPTATGELDYRAVAARVGTRRSA
ncbi:hypothetical protein [Jongsikchunia kroppenstedtii]|uniref:hypothetical protein n=1 Tax=Jongsikchunia kroppenstedtii TaxID=1121721 RepID=UPI00038074B3|nr:hypothetical protein [Jongsikchunia kroppenstedtii]